MIKVSATVTEASSDTVYLRKVNVRQVVRHDTLLPCWLLLVGCRGKHTLVAAAFGVVVAIVGAH
jgi:hypothetical protein